MPEKVEGAKTRAAGDDAELARAVSKSVQEFEEALSKFGGSPCDRYLFMAVTDERVQKALIAHLSQNEIYLRAYCLGDVGIPEEARVVFEFRCMPPRICLLPIAFLVILNAYTGRVLRIIDPYFSGMPHATGGTQSVKA